MVSGVAYQIQTNRAFLREMVQNSEKQRTLFHEDSPAVSNIDESEIESEIFELINQKRAEFGNPAVEWHSKVYEISKVYSREMAEKGDFAHTTASGMSVADRFRTANLFYIIANEILYLIPSSTENIAEQAVEGWMDSPGHRSVIVDRDKFFTHAAVGVTCLDKYCYIVMNFAKFNIERELTFLPDQYLAVNLNDASLGLYDEYPLLIEITSDTPVCVYILEGEEEIDPFLEEFYDRYYDTKGKTDFTRKTAAKKDSYLLIINNGKKSATVSYRLQYN
ncbi:CAP domain-containing protein [Candidatus Woesearchaeota archaeon]|nr:CAP domain-containing protein [Candidatus Woesearchaeota archaeon]